MVHRCRVIAVMLLLSGLILVDPSTSASAQVAGVDLSLCKPSTTNRLSVPAGYGLAVCFTGASDLRGEWHPRLEERSLSA
jgi:hypothetical protein